MRITKNQLKRIIKEELGRVLSEEQPSWWPSPETEEGEEGPPSWWPPPETEKGEEYGQQPDPGLGYDPGPPGSRPKPGPRPPGYVPGPPGSRPKPGSQPIPAPKDVTTRPLFPPAGKRRK